MQPRTLATLGLDQGKSVEARWLYGDQPASDPTGCGRPCRRTRDAPLGPGSGRRLCDQRGRPSPQCPTEAGATEPLAPHTPAERHAPGFQPGRRTLFHVARTRDETGRDRRPRRRSRQRRCRPSGVSHSTVAVGGRGPTTTSSLASSRWSTVATSCQWTDGSGAAVIRPRFRGKPYSASRPSASSWSWSVAPSWKARARTPGSAGGSRPSSATHFLRSKW